MPSFSHVTHLVARGVEATGIAIIVLGLLYALLKSIPDARRDGSKAYKLLRQRAGQAILLGLEILVAADIILTVTTEPTFESVAVLGLIILIRTFLSFSLEVELDGKWPWKQGAEHAAELGDDGPRDTI